MSAHVPDSRTVAAVDLARHLAAACPAHAIDLAGAVPLDGPAAHAEAWFDWLDRKRHADLAYLERTREERADARLNNPWARSLLVFAQRYTDSWSGLDGFGQGAPGDWLPYVARYARGWDYHRVLLRAVKGVLRDLKAVWPGLVAHPSVDTGPYLERDWAEAAGLGFIGKNTCLIHEQMGSGLVLAVAPANLELTGLDRSPRPLYEVLPRGPLSTRTADHCGRCNRCLEACPTKAFAAPYVLDAGRCLSTWTIEWRGRAPTTQRDLQGDRLFGCDVCQQVCPWNAGAVRVRPRSPDLPPPTAGYATLPEHAMLDLADLMGIEAQAFQRHFRRTPLWRAHPEGMRRNALMVAANTGRVDLLDVVRRAANDDPDPEVRVVAAWAAERLEERS